MNIKHRITKRTHIVIWFRQIEIMQDLEERHRWQCAQTLQAFDPRDVLHAHAALTLGRAVLTQDVEFPEMFSV